MYLPTAIAFNFFGTIALCLSVPASPIVPRDSPCAKFADRTFRIIATQPYGAVGSISQTFQAMVEHNFDSKKPLAGPEYSSCTLRKFGKGCRWEKKETSDLDAYKIDHGPFDALVGVTPDIKVSGDGCNDQTLQCSSQQSLLPVSLITRKICKYMRESKLKGYSAQIGDQLTYLNTIKCAEERPTSKAKSSKLPTEGGGRKNP